MKRYSLLACCLVTGLGAGCGSEPALTYGKMLFSDPTVSTASSNAFACVTCHADTRGDARPLPGYDLYDVATRKAWWGGNVDVLLDAANQCITDFMGGKALAADDDKGRALFIYLKSISPDPPSPALPLTVVQNIVDVPSGDAGNGEKLWKSVCQDCHGDAGSGTGRLTTIASIVPNDSITAHGTDPKTGARPVVIEKVRHGKYFMVGGFMPLFSLEALSDVELGDLLAYLETFNLPKSAPTP